MSKVKKEIVEAAALKLMTEITANMPTPAYKFLLGSMSALATLNNGKRIDELFGLVADKDGYLDVDCIKAVIEGGFNASGGKITVDLFKQNSGLMSMLVKPLTLTISREDVMPLIREIEDNSIRDVRLSNEDQKQTQQAPATAIINQAS